MEKWKLFIRQYDITDNDYKVREEIVETNDIYHEIGKIYSTTFAKIDRIDYIKINETASLENKIRRAIDYIEQEVNYCDIYCDGCTPKHCPDIKVLLNILKGNDKNESN